jgi:glycosyltransferase involved in cell wall biosynthesis
MTKKRSKKITKSKTEAKIIQKTLCLVMIVKDEEDSIEKCIKSVAPYISEWVIVDTGSTDKTIEVIHSVMNELSIPGELHERPWVNFEVNRTESLVLSKNKCDYRWIIDADDEFILEGNINPFLTIDGNADAYQLLYKLNNLQFNRTQLVKSSQDWVYKGVLHEFLHLDGIEPKHGRIGNSYVKADISPLKRADSLEEKYANDAKILEDALEKEPDNARYAFYLAQSYRDSKQIEASLKAYSKRVEMGGWEEEVYYSLYMIAKLREKNGDSILDVTNAYSMAWEYRPQRLEALFHVMRKLREQNRHVLAFTYGNTGVKSSPCNDILFLEKEIWQWRFLDEFSLSAFYTGNPEIAIKYIEPVTKSDFFQDLPVNERERLIRNVNHFNQAIEDKKLKIK